MIDAIGMHEVNRWIALAQLDGWGEEYRMLATIAARAMGCTIAELLPYEGQDEHAPTDAPPASRTMQSLGKLAGF
jgi:hypothetical protein